MVLCVYHAGTVKMAA